MSEDHLYDIIVNQLGTSFQTVGYRQMTEIACIKYNINVYKEDVRKAVKNVNPEEVEERKRNCIERRLYWAKGPAGIYQILKSVVFVSMAVSMDLVEKYFGYVLLRQIATRFNLHYQRIE